MYFFQIGKVATGSTSIFLIQPSDVQGSVEAVPLRGIILFSMQTSEGMDFTVFYGILSSCAAFQSFWPYSFSPILGHCP